MTEVTDKVERAIARFERVTRQLDERGGPAREAARRERQRLNAGARPDRSSASAIAVAADLAGRRSSSAWSSRSACSASSPRLLATGVVAAVLIARGGRAAIAAPAPSADLPNGAMVERFDSYLYRTRRALPAPAQAEIDAHQRGAAVAARRRSSGSTTLDPDAQDARRLMSIHLPGLIDRYLRVPAAFRGEQDGEGKTVDERLVEGLAAGRAALARNLREAGARRHGRVRNPGPLHQVALRRDERSSTQPEDAADDS